MFSVSVNENPRRAFLEKVTSSLKVLLYIFIEAFLHLHETMPNVFYFRRKKLGNSSAQRRIAQRLTPQR